MIALLPPTGTQVKHTTYVGPIGAITVNTDSKTIHVHDGVTAGGFPLSKVGHQHAANEVYNWLGYTPGIALTVTAGNSGVTYDPVTGTLDVSNITPVASAPGSTTGTPISLASGSNGASFNNRTNVLSLAPLSSAVYGLTALIDATSTPLTVAVGGTLTASTFAGNGSGLTTLNAGALATGLVPTIVLGSGTADNTKFLRGDGLWISIADGARLTETDIINALTYTPAVLTNGILNKTQLDITSDDVPEGIKNKYFKSSDVQGAITVNPAASGVTYTGGVLDFSALVGGSASSIASTLGYVPAALDPASGKVRGDQLPKITLNNTFTAPNEATMLALVANKGDVCVRTDIGDTFILNGTDPTVLTNWTEMPNPSGFVKTVNGQSGTVVSLSTSDITEGSRLYFTPGRAQAAISIVAGTTGVKYSGGVLDLTALEASSAILQAIATIPTVDVTLPGLYGGKKGSGAQLSLVSTTPQSGYKIFGILANGSGLHMGTSQDDGSGFVSMFNMNPLAGSASLNAGLGGFSLTGDLTVSGSVNGVTASQFHGQFWGNGYNISGLQAEALASGYVPKSRLGSGTASSATILYGDGVWRVAPPGDGSLTLANVDAHARAAISVNSGNSGITYNPSTGVIDATSIVVGLYSVNGKSNANGVITLSSDDITAGTTNKYYTDILARKAISLVSGVSNATYDNTTGILDLSQVGGGAAAVTTISVATANGVSGNVTNPTTTPVITVVLGDIVPSSINSAGNVKGATVTSTSTLAALGNLTVAGNIALTGQMSGGSITSKIVPRTGSTTSGNSFAPTSDTAELYSVTAIGQAFTVANPTGTPQAGQRLTIYLLDNGTSFGITWGTGYNAVGVALPLFTVASKAMYIQTIYNSATSKWDVIDVAVASKSGYEIPLSIQGTIGAAGAKVLNFVVTRAFALPVNLTGSFAKSGTSAASAVVFTIFKNGTSVGSINFAGGSSTGTFSFASNVAFLAGDLMVISAGTADSALADVAINLLGA